MNTQIEIKTKASDLQVGDWLIYRSEELQGGKPVKINVTSSAWMLPQLLGTVESIERKLGYTFVNLEMRRLLIFKDNEVRVILEKPEREASMVSHVGKATTFRGVSID
jgi:hypothetical protein